MSKISVIIPVYNVEKYIDKCLESIVRQTFQDFEVILVNDGSTDESQKIIDKYVDIYPNKFKSYKKANGGVSNARNYGFENSNGEYIIYVDPDDVLASSFLEKLYNNMQNETIDVSICGYTFIKSQDEEMYVKSNGAVVYDKREFLNHFLLRDISFLVVSMLIKRSVIGNNRICFDEKIKFSEDQIFIWDVILSANNIVYTNTKLYGYYLRDDSTMTSSTRKKIEDSYYIVKDRLNNLPISKYPELKYALPRWELGALFTSAKLLDYKNFVAMVHIMNGKTIYKRLKGFKESKAILLSFMLLISNRVFYYVSRGIL